MELEQPLPPLLSLPSYPSFIHEYCSISFSPAPAAAGPPTVAMTLSSWSPVVAMTWDKRREGGRGEEVLLLVAKTVGSDL